MEGIVTLQRVVNLISSHMTIPNQLTMLRIVLVPVFVALLLQDEPYVKLLGVFVFVVASLTDAYDGYHARKYGETTRLGAFLDPLADKLLITAAFLLYVRMGFLVAVRDVVITALRIYAEMKDRPVVTSKEAKYKTLMQNVFAYIIMALLLLREPVFFGSSIASAVNGFLVSDYLDYMMLVVTIFTVYTGISYLTSNWRASFQSSSDEH